MLILIMIYGPGICQEAILTCIYFATISLKYVMAQVDSRSPIAVSNQLWEILQE